MKKIALVLALAFAFCGCSRYEVPNLLETDAQRAAKKRESNETIALIVGASIVGAALLLAVGSSRKD